MKAELLPVPAATMVLEKPPRVEVEIEPVMSDDELTTALETAGGTKLSASNLQLLRRVGIKLKGLGVTHIQRGAVMLDQGKCDEAIDMVRHAMAARIGSDKPRGLTADINRLAQSFAVLMGRKTDVQRLALEIEQAVVASGAPVEEKHSPISGFVPGKQITPQGVPAGGTLVIGQTVNLMGGQQAPKGRPG